MFIFQRSVAGVAAGLGVAILLVVLDRLCCPPQPPYDAPVQQPSACATTPPCAIVRAGS